MDAFGHEIKIYALKLIYLKIIEVWAQIIIGQQF